MPGRLTTPACAEWYPQRAVVRRDAGTWALEGALTRRGLGPVAGVDEAGRGACAGPLVVAACVLRPKDAAKLDGLTDSKLLTEQAREDMYYRVLARAVDHAIVIIPPAEVDGRGVHAANVEGMRRAVARLTVHPGYVLVDGFRVAGLTAPSMPVIKGDQAAACVAAASVLAKVTRDRIMTKLSEALPAYRFDVHKGYCTSDHTAELNRYGPTDEHRWSFVNVTEAAATHGMRPPRRVVRSVSAALVVQNGRPPADEPISVPVSQGGATR